MFAQLASAIHIAVLLEKYGKAYFLDRAMTVEYYLKGQAEMTRPGSLYNPLPVKTDYRHSTPAPMGANGTLTKPLTKPLVETFDPANFTFTAP